MPRGRPPLLSLLFHVTGERSNLRMERTWPIFVIGVVKKTTVAFVEFGGLLRAGHAAEAPC
jgi:hypothetical protein